MHHLIKHFIYHQKRKIAGKFIGISKYIP